MHCDISDWDSLINLDKWDTDIQVIYKLSNFEMNLKVKFNTCIQIDFR